VIRFTLVYSWARRWSRSIDQLLIVYTIIMLTSCFDAASNQVVVYSALDQEFAEPLLEAYEKKTNIDVIAKFDVESTKTVGLTQLIIAEAARPRSDLFWNNEILNTLRLKNKGLLVPFHPPGESQIPAEFKAGDGTWYGFAARARILLVNTKLIPKEERPTSILDLLSPRWKGQIGLAKPLFGTTATHAACLFAVWGDERAKHFFTDLKANDAQILSGNKQVAQAVSKGQIAFGLTDTDDAMGEIEAGEAVEIVYPDRASDQLGTLYIPNTLAIIKGSPHQQAGEALASYLLSPAVEIALAAGPSAQIPLNSSVHTQLRVETPQTVHAMQVDFEAAARIWEQVAAYLLSEFASN
jgi:iron(III) transport system substrate-binding protein